MFPVESFFTDGRVGHVLSLAGQGSMKTLQSTTRPKARPDYSVRLGPHVGPMGGAKDFVPAVR